MSTREVDLGDSPPLRLELRGDRGAELARILAPAPAQVIHLPCRSLVEPAPEPRRFSRLRLMDESPLHYQANIVEETGPMRKGTGLHAFLLGQADRVVLYEDGARNPKFAKYQEFMAKHPGKTILSPEEWETVAAMRASVERNARAMELLQGTQERRIEWDFGGRRCAGTPDSVFDFPKHRRVTELKATRYAKPARLIATARWSHWHAQLSWYGEGLDRALPGLESEEFYIVAVQSTPPYPVTTLRVPPSIIAKGARLWRSWWERLENCEQSSHFPGYSEADVEWPDEETGGADDIDWGDEDETAA